MLAPEDRRLLTDSLRPPDGYELGWVLGATFTLDLPVLLSAPLSFALFDLESGDHAQPDALAVLESLRRYAARMAIFCQAGQIRVPPADQPLYAFLEESIVEARSPRRHALFHPKMWLLRFERPGVPAWYRLICMTRNLTSDRSWDVAVMIEGEVSSRTRAYAENHPLGAFVEALPALALRPLRSAVRQELSRLAHDVRRVRWALPEGFRTVRFWPLGIPGFNHIPFNTRIDRLLIVSPFLSAKALADLTDEGGRADVLVSRLEALQELDRKDLRNFRRIFAFNDAAYLELPDEAAQAPVELTGLHGKLYVAERGWDASVWVGSANATEVAFNGNVEILVELEGPRSRVGIDALLRKDNRTISFASLLVPYQPGMAKPVDEVEERLRLRLDDTRRALAEAGLVARVQAMEDSGYAINLIQGSRRPLRLPDKVTVWCWPVRIRETFAQIVLEDRAPIAVFELGLEQVTSFFAFRMEGSEKGLHRVERFVLNVTLENVPPDRHQRILRSILGDRDRLLRFVLFLLSDGDPEQVVTAALEAARNGGEGGRSQRSLFPLFEALVRALDRNPKNLDRVAALVNDLKQTAEGQALIPEGFEAIWEPVWAARRQLNGKSE